MASEENIGTLLNTERRRRETSIRRLAQKAGVSPAIISRVEQGHCSPSFSTLKKILDVFGLSFADFFGSAKPPVENPIIRKAEMRMNRGIGEGLRVILVNAGRSKDLQLFHETYEPGGHCGKEMLTHQSVEAGICVQGTLQLELDGQAYTVSEGDGWFFDSRLPHRFSNPSKKRAALISANTPAAF